MTVAIEDAAALTDHELEQLGEAGLRQLLEAVQDELELTAAGSELEAQLHRLSKRANLAAARVLG